MMQKIQCPTLGQVDPDYCADRVRRAMQAMGWTQCCDCGDGRREYRRKYNNAESEAGQFGEETKMASKKGECGACRRPGMTLPGCGICGACYARKRDGRLVQDEHGRWVFAIFDDVPNGADYNRTLVRFEGGVVSVAVLVEEMRERESSQEPTFEPQEVAAGDGDTCPECGPVVALAKDPRPEAQAILDVIDRRLAEGLSAPSEPAPADPFAGVTLTPWGGQHGPGPALTIASSGDITLNSVAASALLTRGQRVVLLAGLTDGKAVVGVRPTDATGDGSYALSTCGGNRGMGKRVSCKSFVRANGLRLGQQCVPLVWSDSHRAWCAVVEREG